MRITFFLLPSAYITSILTKCGRNWASEVHLHWKYYYMYHAPHQISTYVLRCSRRSFLGCVNPMSWLPLATGRELTQSKSHLLEHLCTMAAYVAKTNISRGLDHWKFQPKTHLPWRKMGLKLTIRSANIMGH